MPFAGNDIPALPIDSALPDLKNALEHGQNALLVAAPGAGKTTRVPLALADAHFLGGKRIVMLEPRRIVARAAARYMARIAGGEVGEFVGYSVRFDQQVSQATRIEVVTEGTLVRRMQRDPTVKDTGLLIFDEFHERSLEGDLGLAMAREIQEAFRPDLRILVMSATLDEQKLALLLKGAPVIKAEGRLFPVTVHHAGGARRQTVAAEVAAQTVKALARHQESILAFLPGEAEIRRALEILTPHETATTKFLPLFGSLSAQEQDQAIEPSPPGKRKVVLATTLAETSLTIEGIGVVIDGGFKRVPQFDPASGMTRLETVRVSQSAAEQRRGRAGRLAPGVCYRLWPEAENRALSPHDVPEILQADLAPLVLDLAQWGARDASLLPFLDAPPPGALAQARDLLKVQGAIDEALNITPHGRAMASLPLHPRLSHLVVRGGAFGSLELACDIAALLSERDILNANSDASLMTRLDILHGKGPGGAIAVHEGALKRVKEVKRQIERIARSLPFEVRTGDHGLDAGELLALAYTDRIAQAREDPGSFRLFNGGGAVIDAADPLAREKFLAVATTDGKSSNARIRLAAPLRQDAIERLFAPQIRTMPSLEWDKRSKSVIAREQTTLGALVISERPMTQADPDRVADALIEGIRQAGLQALPGIEKIQTLQHRLRHLRRLEPEEWPDLSDERLLADLDTWLKPNVYGMSRLEHVARIDAHAAVLQLLTHAQRTRLDALAPVRFTVPTGHSVQLDYSPEEGPELNVKLQEMFGTQTVPLIAKGRLPLRIVLLSPAGRPLAITQDMASFWSNAYPQVRSEMRGRYPKHFWPENPLTALPTRGRKPK